MATKYEEVQNFQDIDVPSFYKSHCEEKRRKEMREIEVEEARISTERFERSIKPRRAPTGGLILYTADDIIKSVTKERVKKAALPAFLLGVTIATSAYMFRANKISKPNIVAVEKERELEKIVEDEQVIDAFLAPDKEPGFFDAMTKLDKTEILYYRRAKPYAKTLREVSKITGKDALLYASLLGAESDYNPAANSRVGAKGLGQMMSIAMDELDRQLGLKTERAKTLKKLVGDRIDRKKYETDARYQIKVSGAYFNLLVDHFELLRKKKVKENPKNNFNSIEAAASAYNWGGNRTTELINTYGKNWSYHKPVETKTHWTRIKKYGQTFESIESKFKEYAAEKYTMVKR